MHSTFPNIRAEIQIMAEGSPERQRLRDVTGALLSIVCPQSDRSDGIWQSSALLCALITCCSSSRERLEENLPLKCVLGVVLFETSFLKIRFGWLEVSFFYHLDNAVVPSV